MFLPPLDPVELELELAACLSVVGLGIEVYVPAAHLEM